MPRCQIKFEVLQFIKLLRKSKIEMLPFKIAQILKPNNATKNKLLIFGYGYVASALSESLDNFTIVATSRSGKKSDFVKIIDFEAGTVARELKDTTHILSTIAPDNSSRDPVIGNFKEIISKANKLKYIGYISATSVYGDHEGKWVDETSKLHLTSKRGENRYEAEKAWQKAADEKGIPLIIFRIAGIYGKGRNVLETLKRGNVRLSMSMCSKVMNYR